MRVRSKKDIKKKSKKNNFAQISGKLNEGEKINF